MQSLTRLLSHNNKSQTAKADHPTPNQVQKGHLTLRPQKRNPKLHTTHLNPSLTRYHRPQPPLLPKLVDKVLVADDAAEVEVLEGTGGKKRGRGM
jgi:hypothetical protein